MQTNRNILIRQSLLLLAILVFSYWIIGWYSNFKDTLDYTSGGILFDLPIGLIIFISCFFLCPLTFFLFLRVKNNIDIKNLNKIFQIISWLLVLIIIASFFIFVLWELFYINDFELGLWGNLKLSFLYHFSWPYVSDVNHGLINDIKQIVIYLPYLGVSILLYLALRNNKLLNEKENKDLI